MKALLLVTTVVIFSIGLLMVFDTSSAEVLDKHLSRSIYYASSRQVAYAVIGILIALLCWRVGYDHLLKFSPYFLLCGIIFLILVFVPGIAHPRNGAHRWIGIGNFTFQPSELIKFLVPMTFIEWALSHHLAKKPITFFAFCKIMAFLSLPIFLVMIEPDNGAAAVIGANLIPLFFLCKVKMRYWALPILLLVAVGVFAAFQLPYVRGRIDVYLHPEKDLKGKGHQAYQAKIAAGSGYLFGRGPGGSLQKLTYLPEAQNDYIAAIYAEEFGFVGMVGLIFLYMLFAFAGFSIAMRSTSLAGCYLAMTITFLISMQAFLNLGVVSGLLPSKGVNLPFFSQGGTSLVTNIIGLVILMNITHEKKSHLQRRRDGRSPLSSNNRCKAVKQRL
ncbi:MAG: putative peptidoglycan glycosyltransferase FtsW [Chlamydiales bacterium]|nr:putative peptidoglycan glycosyltransferase FtsW [Chlamydiales bacterium]MCH9619865.1 putative peptidoglycan glycosyltransferase FtsW [Chlamydiales bacterium]MCH9622708.1 putative peptidoglycan glycosyltransferase FtsW [Chlamydiales bacterium]